MSESIISWNARSLETCKNPGKKGSLLDLISSAEPSIIAIQDSGKLDKYNFFTGYQKPIISEHFVKNRNVMTFFKDGINFTVIENKTTLYGAWQTFKVHKNVNTDAAFYFTNIYLAGNTNSNDFKEIDSLFNRYQFEPFIISGDLNAKNKSWDNLCVIPNGNGTKLCEIFEKYDYVTLNNGEYTRISDNKNHSNSAIDLTVVSSIFFSNSLTWTTHDDTMGSDHKPQMINIGNNDICNEFVPSLKIIYKTDKADPIKFRSCFTGVDDMLSPLQTDTPDDFEELSKRIINHITEAANVGIPNNKKYIDNMISRNDNNITPKVFKKTHFWFDEECQIAKKERKYRQHRWEKTRSIADLIQYKKSKAQFRKITKKSKMRADKQFIDSIDITTTAKQSWEKLNRLTGKFSNKTTVKPLVQNTNMSDMTINDSKGQATILGQQYHSVSHDANLDPKFLKKRSTFLESKEGSALYESQENTNDSYNSKITMSELTQQLRKRKKRSAPGEDSVNYWMIRNSPLYVHKAILNLFNLIWSSGNIPQLFKTASVIPIPKSEKDLSSPTSYRPIALTSHLGKLLEAIINERLKSHLESEGHLSPYQSGFRNCKETMEQVVRIEADIRKANDMGMVLCGVFLDISKAFDTAQHCYILKHLNQYNVKGNMFNYCKDFMSKRLFSVKVGNSVSEMFSQHNGVPQGAVISPTLFLISINEISKVLNKRSCIGQYADDTALWRSFKPKNENAQNVMSQETNRIVSELENIGYKVNAEKTQAVLFTTKQTPEFNLTIKGKNVVTGPSAKYLGITLDKKLTFKHHLDNRRKSGYKILNLLKRCKGRGGFASKPKSLKTISKSLLESKVLYGAEVMHNVDKKAFKATESLLNQAKRVITGTTKRTRIECLNMLTDEQPAAIKLENAKLRFWARKTCQDKSIVGQVLNDPTYMKNKSNKGRGIGVVKNTNTTLKELNIAQSQAAPYVIKNQIVDVPSLEIDTSLTDRISKQRDNEVHMKQASLEHLSTSYKTHIKVYTDGSKIPDPTSNEMVGIGIYSGKSHLNFSLSRRVSDNVSIATAELKAIHKALHKVKQLTETEHCPYSAKVVICTDSLSAAQALQSNDASRPDIVQQIIRLSQRIKSSFNIAVTLLWIPSHVNIAGNEKADLLAKKALNRPNIDCDIGLGKTELESLIVKRQQIKRNRQWQHLQFDSVKHTREIVPSLLNFNISLGNQYEKRNRLLVNAPRFLSKGPINCDFCEVNKTVKHVLLECDLFIGNRDYIIDMFRAQNTEFNLKNILDVKPLKTLRRPILKYINGIMENI